MLHFIRRHVNILRVNSCAYGGESVWKRKAVEKMKYVALAERYLCEIIKKGKAIPLQAWTSPEGSRRLRLPDFKTIGT